MANDTHIGEVRGGKVHTLCGRTFPVKRGKRPAVFWGVCPECKRLQKRRGK